MLAILPLVFLCLELFAVPEECEKYYKALWDLPVRTTCPEGSGIPMRSRAIFDWVPVKITPYGYVRCDLHWDTRQIIGSRENHVLVFPEQPLYDIFGRDVNEHPSFHMRAIETRAGIKLTGPDWGTLKTDGLIEADFRGLSDEVNANIRMRHAFGRVSWETGSLLFGQWWHPLFIVECYPNTVSANVGEPFEPQAREPQLRLTQRWKWFELIFAIASQRDFQSNGPLGIDTIYIRNAVVPNIHLQMRGYFDTHVVGIAGDYLRLVPRLFTDLPVDVTPRCPNFEQILKVNEHIDSFIFEAFGGFIFPPCSLRAKVIWAQNANNQLLISGFGIRTQDQKTGKQTYSNTACISTWLDFSYLFHCDEMELGIFGAYTKNLGSSHCLFIDPNLKEPIIFGLSDVSQNLDYQFRVSPRFCLMKDPIRFGMEVEYTQASWGTPNRFGKVENGKPFRNIRLELAIYYMF